MTVSKLSNYSGGHILRMNYNYLGHVNLSNSSYLGLFDVISNTTSLETFSLTPYLSTPTPAGTQWNLSDFSTKILADSDYHDFFSADVSPCDPHWECLVSTNNESYVQSDCSRMSQRWCGECGCNENLTHCDYPDLTGTYCDNDDILGKAYITVFENCTEIHGECSGNQLCNQYTLTPLYTISCYNTVTMTNDFCINALGQNVSCSDPSITALTEAEAIAQASNMTAGAEAFGLAMGWGGTGGKFLIGLILTIAIMLGINAGPGFVTKREFHIPKELNILFLIMLVIGFTIYIQLFDPILLVVIVIFGGVLLASKITPVIMARMKGED